MLEISIHNSKREKIFDYKKSKSTKLFGIAGLLAIPSSQEVQRMLENADKVTAEYNASLKSFEEAIKGCEISTKEANEILNKCECMFENVTKSTTKDIDVSNTGRFKDWLLGSNSDVPKISDVGEANGDWITSQLQQEAQKSSWELAQDDIHSIAEAIRGFGKFCDDVKWCIQNPIEATVIGMEWATPGIAITCLVICSIGVLLKICRVEKFLGRTPNQLIASPIIFYIIYLIILSVLKAI